MTRRVVIIGGGFGGLAAARRLGRGAARSAVHVTLIDRSNHHTFQPLLYQVATAALAPQDVGHSLRGALHDSPNVRFRLGTVAGVDWPERRLLLSDGSQQEFDDLIVAAGAVTADFGVPGVAEHAFPLKDLGDAVALQPQLAAVALQSGRHAAEQILRQVKGQSARAFHYTDKGIMATIGRNAAVAELPLGVRLQSFPAWTAWLVLHLLFLIGFRNRLSVCLQWGWSYLTYDRSARVVFDDPAHQRRQ